MYHLAWESDWQQSAREGKYYPASLETEGFVHATREPEKVVEVANLFFSEERTEELLLITLDESRVGAPVKDEDPGVGHRFPHIYGPINLAAVLDIRPMHRVAGLWKLPEEA